MMKSGWKPPGIEGHLPIGALVHSYLVADYRWQHDGDWHDLRLGLPAPALEMLCPEVQTFGLLSAWNPHSIKFSEIDNRNADHALHDDLNDTGLHYCAAFASAPNRSWREPSWIVAGMAVEDFDALSRYYGQLGTIWWNRGELARLRIDAARPADFAHDESSIDWLK